MELFGPSSCQDKNVADSVYHTSWRKWTEGTHLPQVSEWVDHLLGASWL